MTSSRSPAEAFWSSRQFRETTDAFFALAKDRNLRPKTRKPRSAHQCTFCGKDNQEHLSTCALCKCARYCNRGCQIADYKARHKQECAAFVHPPITRAFTTEPVGDEKYPQHPIFAHGHREGVGCWISVDGEYDTSLKALAESMDVATEDMHTVLARRIKQAPDAEQEAGDLSRAFIRNLLTLSIMVQNRRKDKMKVLVFGAQTQLVTLATTRDALLKGKSPMEQVHLFEAGGNTLAALSVVEDPWEKQPRLQIKNIDGTDIKNDAHMPPSVHDRAKGVVSLEPGEYVVFRIQFRVGSDGGISTEPEALGRLAGVNLASTLWRHGSNPMFLDYALSQNIHKDGHVPQGLGMTFDYHALYEYYLDYMEKGAEAFIESHFGKRRVDAFRAQSQNMQVIGRQTMQALERNGEIDQFLGVLRQCGMGEMIDKVQKLRVTVRSL